MELGLGLWVRIKVGVREVRIMGVRVGVRGYLQI